MKSFRWIWVLTLLFYCSGCTAFAPGYLPGDGLPGDRLQGDRLPGEQLPYEQVPPDDSAGEASLDSSPKPEMVIVGMGIRLTLVNGKTVDGKVLEITDEALAFGTASNYGLEKVYYPFEDIAKIEVPHTEWGKTSMAAFLVLAVAAITITVFFYLLMAGSDI